MKSQKGSSIEIDITNSTAPLLIKFGFLCVSKNALPNWIVYLGFIWSHLQMLAVYLKSALTSLPNDTVVFYKPLKVYCQFMFMSEYVDLNQATAIRVASSLLISIYIIFLFVAVVILTTRLYYNKKIPAKIKSIWEVICYIHPLVLFFPIHCILLDKIETFHRGIMKERTTGGLEVGIAYFCIVVNWALATLLSSFFKIVIKTKDPLCSKCSRIRRNEIFEKTVSTLLMLWSNDVLIYINLVHNFMSAFYRDRVLVSNLSYYRPLTLKMAAILQAPVTAAGLLALITRILHDFEINLKLNFFVVSWLLIVPFVIKIYSHILSKRIEYCLISGPNMLNSHELLGKRDYLGQLLVNKEEPNKRAQRFNYEKLFLEGKLKDVKMFRNYDLKNKRDIKSTFLALLRESLKLYPKSNLLKIVLARHYAKFNELYLQANDLILEVKQNRPSFPVQLSMWMIIREMENILLRKYKVGNLNASEEDKLNVLHYIQMIEMDQELRDRIIKQNSLQIQFWKIWLSAEPDFKTLTNLANKVNKKRIKTEALWKNYQPQFDPNFISPLLTMGLYMSFVNNNLLAGDKLLEQYQK